MEQLCCECSELAYSNRFPASSAAQICSVTLIETIEMSLHSSPAHNAPLSNQACVIVQKDWDEDKHPERFTLTGAVPQAAAYAGVIHAPVCVCVCVCVCV